MGWGPFRRRKNEPVVPRGRGRVRAIRRDPRNGRLGQVETSMLLAFKRRADKLRADYLEMTYYERWIACAHAIDDGIRGLVTPTEIENRKKTQNRATPIHKPGPHGRQWVPDIDLQGEYRQREECGGSGDVFRSAGSRGVHANVNPVGHTHALPAVYAQREDSESYRARSRRVLCFFQDTNASFSWANRRSMCTRCALDARASCGARKRNPRDSVYVDIWKQPP